MIRNSQMSHCVAKTKSVQSVARTILLKQKARTQKSTQVCCSTESCVCLIKFWDGSILCLRACSSATFPFPWWCNAEANKKCPWRPAERFCYSAIQHAREMPVGCRWWAPTSNTRLAYPVNLWWCVSVIHFIYSGALWCWINSCLWWL